MAKDAYRSRNNRSTIVMMLRPFGWYWIDEHGKSRTMGARYAKSSAIISTLTSTYVQQIVFVYLHGVMCSFTRSLLDVYYKKYYDSIHAIAISQSRKCAHVKLLSECKKM